MDGLQIAALSTLAVAGAALAWVVRPLVIRLWRGREELAAQELFARHKGELEATFFRLAAGSGKPRGLRWLATEFRNEVCFARDRQTGLLAAFVGVNIRFEAIPGGDMEGVAAVGNVRDAAALFHFQHGGWGTGGKTLFNVSPREALARFQGQFEQLPSSKPST